MTLCAARSCRRAGPIRATDLIARHGLPWRASPCLKKAVTGAPGRSAPPSLSLLAPRMNGRSPRGADATTGDDPSVIAPGSCVLDRAAPPPSASPCSASFDEAAPAIPLAPGKPTPRELVVALRMIWVGETEHRQCEQDRPQAGWRSPRLLDVVDRLVGEVALAAPGGDAIPDILPVSSIGLR